MKRLHVKMMFGGLLTIAFIVLLVLSFTSTMFGNSTAAVDIAAFSAYISGLISIYQWPKHKPEDENSK